MLSIPHFINAIGFAEEMIEKMGQTKWPLPPKQEVIYSKKSGKQHNRGDVYHHSSSFDFMKEDYEYIEDKLSTGECAVCGNNKMVKIENGVIVCDYCDSYYNIPSKETLVF